MGVVSAAVEHRDLPAGVAVDRSQREIERDVVVIARVALILFLAFVALASGPSIEIKVFATGLAAGIALDATIVRALVVPAVVSLLGRANWWRPGRANRPES